jgi:ABC-type lipoprotein release transport system permease subunit
MWAFVKIAWRDLWRHRLRTLLTLGAITFGAAIMLFVLAWQNGKKATLIRTGVRYFEAHLQVHRAGYQDDQTLARAMPLKPELLQYLDQSKLVAGYSPRLCTEALVQAGNNMAGGMICGVMPEKELKVSRVAQTFFPGMIKVPKGMKTLRRFRGEFLADGLRGEAVLGDDLAKDLQVDVGDKISMLGQDYYGSMASANFKVKGIFHSGSPAYDRSLMLVNLGEMQDLLVMPVQATQVAVIVKDEEEIPKLSEGVYNTLAGDQGPWKVEQGKQKGLWMVRPLKPNLEPDSPLQIANQAMLKDALNRILELEKFSLQLRAQLEATGQKINALGVDPEKENAVSGLFKTIPAGRDWALVSDALLGKMGLKPGDEIAFSGVNYLEENFELKLKIAGGFQADQTATDVYVPLALLQEKLGMGENVNQAALLFSPRLTLEKARALINSRLNWEVVPWQELTPEMVQMGALGDAGNAILISILLIVIAFVFLLTILMSVLDRAREFGIMKAIGTRPSEIFGIIFLESVMLGLLGTAIGILVGGLPALYYTLVPADLSRFSTSFAEFGFDPYMYAKLEWRMVLYAVVINFVIAVLVTLPPAVRAARTKPMQSLRLQ